MIDVRRFAGVRAKAVEVRPDEVTVDFIRMDPVEPAGASNGGPQFTFTEAVSFQVSCETQEEVDAYWSKLSAGGEEGPWGWPKDRYGVSWQIVPTIVPELLGGPDPEKTSG